MDAKAAIGAGQPREDPHQDEPCAIPDCDACAAGICSWCGHVDCPDLAHGPAPGHGENARCTGCPDCDADEFGDDESDS